MQSFINQHKRMAMDETIPDDKTLPSMPSHKKDRRR